MNAVMAGAPAESMPLLCAAIDAMADPVFNLFALNTTTSCVVPGMFVNGPARHTLSIPFDAGCFGGAPGPAPAIGRAAAPRDAQRRRSGRRRQLEERVRAAGPGRGHRRGRMGGALAVAAAGRAAGRRRERRHRARLHRDDRRRRHRRRQRPGPRSRSSASRSRSPARTRSSAPTTAPRSSCALAPPWADLIAKAYPDIEDVQERLWAHAALPVDRWPAAAPGEGGRERPRRRRRSRAPGGEPRAHAGHGVRRPRQPARARAAQLRADPCGDAPVLT